MLIEDNFSIGHIRKLQAKSGRDPVLIERVLYAFGLLEALVRVNTPFIFKGGSCLMLLLKHPLRLSTDIDIIIKQGTNIDTYIKKASVLFPFTHFEEQKRIGKNNIEKRHFKFYYQSPMKEEDFYIILDVLIESNKYSTLIKKEISNELLLVKEPKVYVSVPNTNCILGDKLTAFAPHTIGIAFGYDKELEIIKQMYDVATLIDEVDTFQEVKKTYKRVAADEIAYRGLNITYKDCLNDTIRASLCIISKGYRDNKDYALFMQGVQSIKNHIFAQKYSGEIATIQACKVFCLAAYILSDKKSMVKITNPGEYIDAKIKLKEYSKLSYIRKINIEAYGYLIEGIRVLDELKDE